MVELSFGCIFLDSHFGFQRVDRGVDLRNMGLLSMVSVLLTALVFAHPLPSLSDDATCVVPETQCLIQHWFRISFLLYFCVGRCLENQGSSRVSSQYLAIPGSCRWFKAERHRDQIAAFVRAFSGERDLHLLDAFGASKAMTILDLN